MMNKEECLTGVVECVAESLAINQNEISEKTLLVTELGAESLDVMDIMFQLEEKFDINLQKEDFNFLDRLQQPREELIVNDHLTESAIIKLREWLPALPENTPIRPGDLGSYLSIHSIVKLVQVYKQ